MWENHQALNQRIRSILGDDSTGRNLITSLKLVSSQALVEVYEIFDTPPKNFLKKGKDTLRFDLFFEPKFVSVRGARETDVDKKPILSLSETEIEFKLGRFVYKYLTERITFSGFQALSFEKVVDNNFGRMIDEEYDV